MADETARRREVRRRKILDNSEARWKKIVGNEDLPITRPPPESEQPSYAPTVAEEDASSRLSADPAEEEALSSNGTAKRRVSSVTTSDAYAFPKKVSDAENRGTYCRSRSDSHRGGGSCAQLVLDYLQIDELSLAAVRSWLVLLVAAVIRFLISFEQSTLYTKSIIVPFCLLEATFIVYEMLMQKVPRSSSGGIGGIPTLLGAALILWGVSPSLVGRISRLVNAFLETLKDLSVYLFSFTLCHVLYRLC